MFYTEEEMQLEDSSIFLLEVVQQVEHFLEILRIIKKKNFDFRSLKIFQNDGVKDLWSLAYL